MNEQSNNRPNLNYVLKDEVLNNDIRFRINELKQLFDEASANSRPSTPCVALPHAASAILTEELGARFCDQLDRPSMSKILIKIIEELGLKVAKDIYIGGRRRSFIFRNARDLNQFLEGRPEHVGRSRAAREYDLTHEVEIGFDGGVMRLVAKQL